MPLPDLPPPPPRASEQAEYALLRDARAVRDAVLTRFSDFQDDRKMVWALAEIDPGPQSGAATVPGASINAESGALVSPPGAQTVLTKEGKWKRLTMQNA